VAPLEFQGITAFLVTLLIGCAFGFVLENAGFGNALNLSAQFYLRDMRVLKVMFTAIVTAMLLIFLSSALGLLDVARIFVPPTYWGAAVVGGFVLGIGFIIGGYCPGTSLVSLATLKLDGAFFVLGVACGLFGFGLSMPWVWEFWNQALAAGRLTLFDLLGIDAGWVVIGVLVMAAGAFWLAEWLERLCARDTPPQRIGPHATRWRRAALLIGLGIALVTVALGQPSTARKMLWRQAELEQRLAARDMFIDAGELLGLMHNNQIPLRLLDVRSEADFNLFHLVDARRVSLAELESDAAAHLPAEAIVVIMSNDEDAAAQAWERLAVQGNLNAYILAGGINRWLDVYCDRLDNVPGTDVPTEGPDTLRHAFSSALGDRTAWARPDRATAPARGFVAKVKMLKPVRSVGGGCG
jgi:rhodanese-related sulfurtransferase